MGRGTGSLVTCCLVGLLVAAPATAATITVNTTTDERTAGDGLCSLREAISTVNGSGNSDCAAADSGGNTIELGAHTYPLTLVFLLGGGGSGCVSATGSDTTDNTRDELSVAGTVQNLTIEGAGASQTIIDACKLADRALEVKSGATVTLKNLTITNGHARGGSPGANTGLYETTAGAGNPGADGGGILNEGTLTLIDSAVTNSNAGDGGNGGQGTVIGDSGGLGASGGQGGGIFSSGSLTVSDSTISGNFAGNGGVGGMGVAGSVANSLSGNGGSGGGGGTGGGGGGIAYEGGTATVATVTGSTITGNQSGAGGAGQPGQNSDPSKGFGGNGGSGGAGGNGAGIASAGVGGSLQATNDTIEGNVTGNGADGKNAGTGVGGEDGQPGNGGNGGFGGGLLNVRQSAQLVNLTVAENSTGKGGGAGAATNTFPAGTPGAEGHGGGFYGTLSSPTIQNTILNNNQPGGDCRTASSITDGGHNLIYSPPSIGGFISDPCHFTSGTGISADPMLDPLADNGGPTQTMRLQPGSPAIDQVPSSGAGCPATDQRGVTRPAGAACDIGAYEVAGPAATTGPASQVGATSATISATVTANAADAAVHFEFGTDTSYGSSTPDQHVTGASAMALSTQLLDLKPGTTYHYRVVATSIDGTATGSDRTFQTPAFQPNITVLISGLKVKPKRVHRKRGARVRYTDLAASTVHFVLSRCTRAVRGHCKRYRRVRAFSRHDAAGPNHFRLRVGHLKRGRYLLAATPTLNGATGATAKATFRIVS
jgi:CSLREA domain-containing protein